MKDNKVIQQRISTLKKHLEDAIEKPTRMFREIRDLKNQGLYIVFYNEHIIYIGKTSRDGNTRLREMKSDYRSHTLNRKILQEHLEAKLGIKLSSFNQKTKSTLAIQEILTEQEFKKEQHHINHYINSELRFKFYEIEGNELSALEHFAIGVFNPRYND